MASIAALVAGRSRWAVLACTFFCYIGGPQPVSAQRLKEYNLWVCPHCEKGVKAADVTDLKCEGEAANSGGIDWRWVKAALHRFVRTLQPSSEPRSLGEAEQLMHVAAMPVKGECYLGIVALGFFSFNFMDATERRLFIRTTVFGGVTFQRIVPLSYWDIYASGWPIFGLLAVAGEAVQRDIAEAAARRKRLELEAKQGASGLGSAGAGDAEVDKDSNGTMFGMTGIDLSPRSCCDFPVSAPNSEDQDFLVALHDSLGGYKWVEGRGDGTLPLRKPLQYLASSAERGCSWGRATAYFAMAETLLAGNNGALGSHWNTSRALFSLGEHNLDGCEANTTAYHLMQSVWPFWHILGRLEQRRLPTQATEAVPDELAERFGKGVGYSAPRASASSIRSKWRHLLSSRNLDAGSSGASAKDTAVGEDLRLRQGAGREPAALECLEGAPGLAHVALSADLKQIDGLVVTLHSGVLNSGVNASRLCFHAFALPHQRSFVSEALQCAFGSMIEVLGPNASDGSDLQAFRLNGTARLLLHSLDAGRVRRSAGLPAAETEEAVMRGEVNLRKALDSDTGNLGAIHNFARFALHELLPRLPRVVYLDVDILVKGNLCELYDAPMLSADGEEGTIAAVRRSNQPLRVYVDVLQPAVPAWVPSEALSFNAGVMVIDLVRWRERHVSRLVAEWISTNARRRLWLHGSQPPLLLLFHDEVVPLHWSWNVDGLGHRLNYPKEVLRQAKVLHWTGPLKPWRHHGVNRLLWEPYALEYCPGYSVREHTTTCRPDSWFC